MAASPLWVHLHKALADWGDKIVQNIKKEMRIDKTVASRRTINSIEAKQEKETIAIYAEEAKGTDMSILEFIDKGRGRGTPPPHETIAEWMKAKGVRPKRNNKFVKSTPTNIKRSAMGIAQSIGRKGTIKRFGYMGSDVLNQAVNPIAERMTIELLEAYSRDVEEFIEANRK